MKFFAGAMTDTSSWELEPIRYGNGFYLCLGFKTKSVKMIDSRPTPTASITAQFSCLNCRTFFRSRPLRVGCKNLLPQKFPPLPSTPLPKLVNAAQTHARGLIVQLEHPSIGTAKSIANPIRFSATPVSYRLPPPLLGEHTEQVLRDLGYSVQEVNGMSTTRMNLRGVKTT
jgi:hypothetical protein